MTGGGGSVADLDITPGSSRFYFPRHVHVRSFLLPCNQSLGCFTDVVGDRALEVDLSRACDVDERPMSPAVRCVFPTNLGPTRMWILLPQTCGI